MDGAGAEEQQYLAATTGLVQFPSQLTKFRRGGEKNNREGDPNESGEPSFPFIMLDA